MSNNSNVRGKSNNEDNTEELKKLWEFYNTKDLKTLTFSDAVVQELWHLYSPILAQTPLIPLPVAGSATAWMADSPQYRKHLTYPTHIFYISLHPTIESSNETLEDQHVSVLTQEMSAVFREKPHIVLPLLEYYMAILEGMKRTSSTNTDRLLTGHKPYHCVYCSVVGHTNETSPFNNLRASLLGQLITVKGTVVRMSPCRLMCTSMTFVCELCSQQKTVPTEDGVLNYPGPCFGRCKGYKWAPQLTDSTSEEVQMIKLQESVDKFDTSDSGNYSSSLNRVIEVETRAPFLDNVSVGDSVCFCGLLTTRRGPNARTSNAQLLCLQARSVQSLRRQGGRDNLTSGSGPLENTWSMAERGKFFEMARQPQWFNRLVASLAPSLYGIETLKESVLLAILGGTPRFRGFSRSNIHMLMVGDPGLGKSQLLRAACNVAPRSAFVCAHSSSSCGLTVTLGRDPVSNEVTFEAGAVVHGDGGITCIDEIDKTGGDLKALLEVMEQESISIAKAGLVFSMPVKTSVLAAGNPIGGRFDLSKPLSANINLSPALLSRFDIVVCMRDIKSESTHHLTTHVLNLHQPVKVQTNKNNNRGNDNPTGILSTDLVQSFIIFAKETCFPVLGREACAVLKDYYLQKRGGLQQGQSVHESCGGVSSRMDGRSNATEMELPLTPRYLYALIRVAEARAKVELRPEVTVEDATYAVRLLESCLETFVTTEGISVGKLGGTSGKKRSQKDEVINLLKLEIVQGSENSFSYNTIISICEQVGCKNPSATLHQLNEFGVLLKKGEKYTLRSV